MHVLFCGAEVVVDAANERYSPGNVFAGRNRLRPR